MKFFFTRFSYEMSCCVSLTRFYEISCFLSLMRFPYDCIRFALQVSYFDFTLFWPLWGFLMRFDAFLPLWDVFMKFIATCCDLLIRLHAFWLSKRGGCWWDFLMGLHGVMYGRLSVHDASLDVEWFCACKLCGSLAGEMNVSFVEVIGASASALGDRWICVEVVLFVSSACITPSRNVCLRRA